MRSEVPDLIAYVIQLNGSSEMVNSRLVKAKRDKSASLLPLFGLYPVSYKQCWQANHQIGSGHHFVKKDVISP